MMSLPQKSIVRRVPQILLRISYADDKRNFKEAYTEYFPETDTIEDILRSTLRRFQLENIPLNQVNLIRILHLKTAYPFPASYLHKTLSELKIQNEFMLQFHRPNITLPPSISHLSIYGPHFKSVTWPWDKNSATLEMLLDYVIDAFSLQDVERTRIHLFRRGEEMDLSLPSETLLTDLGIDGYSSIDVQIIPPLTPVTSYFDDSIVVQCSSSQRKLFDVKVSRLDSFQELKDKIQQRLGNHRLRKVELFDANYHPIVIKYDIHLLGLVGIKSGDRIFAHLHLDPSMETTNTNSLPSISNDPPEEEKVTVFIAPKTYSSNHFQIPIKKTVAELIESVENATKCGKARKLEIRWGNITIDPEKSTQRLVDFRVDGKNPIHVTVLDSPSMMHSTTMTTWVKNSIYEKDSRKSPPVGLYNIGNTCFMNSALQCLAHAQPLTKFFLDILSENPSDLNSTEDSNVFYQVGSLAGAYANLLKYIWTKSTSRRSYASLFTTDSFTPRDIKDIIGNLAPRFATYEQQDAQEFMSFFLDQLDQEFQRSEDQSWKSIIKELFYGKLQSTIKCQRCQHSMITINPFNLLSLPLHESERIFSIEFVGRGGEQEKTFIPIGNHLRIRDLVKEFTRQSLHFHYEITVLINDQPADYATPLKEILTNEIVFIEGDHWNGSSSSSDLDSLTRKIQLEKCLEDFCSEEDLDETIFCEGNCQERMVSKKQLKLEMLPPILILQLKRFSHEKGFREKIETFVEYPVENLNLNRFVSSSTENSIKDDYIYDLFAVSNHTGSIHFGHYTAYARHGDQWFRFSDSYVSSVFDRKEIVSKDAYLLFYIQRNRNS